MKSEHLPGVGARIVDPPSGPRPDPPTPPGAAMTPEKLDELERLVAGMTPGPWQALPHDHSRWDGRRHALVAEVNGDPVVHGLFVATDMHPDQSNATAAAIVALGNDALDLIAAARREAALRERYSLPSVRKALAVYRPLVERDGYVNWDALAQYIAIEPAALLSEVPQCRHVRRSLDPTANRWKCDDCGLVGSEAGMSQVPQ